jgi:L-alanine-DL-glutamate epimerase-like enolase superfamily enzyme
MLSLRDTQGYRAFKVRIGSSGGHDHDQWPGRTEELITTVRKTLGSNVVLLADANSCFTPKKAIEVGKMLEDCRFGHFEEPCPYWELDWTKQVTDTLDIPVAGGEQDNSIPLWNVMARDGVVDILQPDVCYAGGVTRTIEISEIASRFGKLCVPHSANHSLVTVFTLHVWNSLKSHGPFLEFSIEDQHLYHEMYEPALEVHNGMVAIPDLGPGWGIRIKEHWLENAQYQCTSV